MRTNKIRVLVVDDSAFMRKKISEMINHSEDCEVIGTARDGFEALQIIQTLKPDVVTLDLHLPRMDGLTCLGYIMSEWPTPVVVLAACSTEENMTVVEALEYGAVDFVSKPGGMISLYIDDVAEELLNKLRLAAKIPKNKLKLLSLTRTQKQLKTGCSSLLKLVAIGASTGGPSALSQILSALPGDLKAAVLIIQHMPEAFIKSFSERLNQHSELYVKVAENGDPILAGKVLVAPAGFEMTVAPSGEQGGGETIRLIREKVVLHHVSPSIDKTFSSVADVFTDKVLGLILTGMGRDGTEGCRKIKAHGGNTIAEDKSTCIVNSMPSSAVAARVIDQVVRLENIPAAILAEVMGDFSGKR